MSTYRIEKTSNGIKVTCDGKPIKFVRGETVAYAILYHCGLGKAEADLFCNEFAEKLLIADNNPIEITSEEILSFTELIKKVEIQAQQVVRNTEPI